ncbi:hypothetical protein L1887_09462 [Cichorium endivia]|nr:hypothetical protein L1887_09462 [Cichorium endivia]
MNNMKQLHKQSIANQRRDEEMPSSQTPPYSPKSFKHPSSSRYIPRSINYILKEQRLLFILIGIVIGSAFVIFKPSFATISITDTRSENQITSMPRSIEISHQDTTSHYSRPVNHGVGRVPVGIGKKRRRVVVTGGSGFVGSHLVDKLIARGDDVIVIDNFFTGRKENVMHHFGNPRFELIRHDVVEPILLECDYKTNVMGTLNMLGLAKRIGARFLLTSTSEVRIARIFNTYGPRMCLDDGRVVSNFVAQAIRKQPMTVYGDGKQTRSFQYVSDLVDGLMALMEGEHIGPFNLGNPGEFTMLELAQVVKETIDPSATIEFRENTADDPQKRKPDITKAKSLLNWEPKITLREGLPRMAADFRNRILNEDEGKGQK